MKTGILFFLLAGLAWGGADPRDWIPLRWDGGPLELKRRAQKEKPAPLDEAQRTAIHDWYQPETLPLLEGTPYNCLLLTWSLGKASEHDLQQRQLAKDYASRAREKDFAVLAVIEFGPEWLEAAQAAGDASFDGVVLEGELPKGAPKQALEALREKKPSAVLVPMDSWERVQRGAEFTILASRGGLWPGMLTSDEATGWGAGPTSNPWVLSNAWQIGVVRADGSDRPVWMGHRPNRRRDQPIGPAEHIRAVADAGMAGARWVVALGDDWRVRLGRGDPEAREQWSELSRYVRFFEENKDWRKFPVWPSVVVVHDPATADAFATFDVLNMLGVRHIPHRVVLRPNLSPGAVDPSTRVVAYDFAPPDESEHGALQEFTAGGGTLLVGPHWSQWKYAAGADAKRLVAGKGTILAYPAEEVDSDQFSRDVRDTLNKKHAGPRLYNVGTIISLLTHDPETGRALLQMTEYGDYPTENVTVRFPRKFAKAELHTVRQPPAALEIYEEEDGIEIVIPSVPSYCAVILE
jgi:hypothetical protein